MCWKWSVIPSLTQWLVLYIIASFLDKSLFPELAVSPIFPVAQPPVVIGRVHVLGSRVTGL